MANQTTLNESDLQQFTGTEQWYQHGINRAVLFTDGQNMLQTPQGPIGCLTRSL